MEIAMVQIINLIYYALLILIFARFILSWVSIGPYELREWVFRLTEPLLAPVLGIVPLASSLLIAVNGFHRTIHIDPDLD